jgi:[acyl-carrier-protein] S-malonyltransferase
MGRGFWDSSPESRKLFERADQTLGYPISRLCLEGPEETLRLTANAQPALLTVSVACDALLRKSGVRPSAVAGHSLGEYSALVSAGSLAFEDAVRIVHGRGKYMQEAVPVGEGSMAAIIGIDMDVLGGICAEVSARTGRLVSVANDNAPGQIVVAGHAAAVEQAMEAARASGARKAVRLPVSAPFHCELMGPAQERLAADLQATEFKDPAIPVVTNVDAREIRTGAEARDALTRQVTGRVRWRESVARLRESGVRLAVEVGPGKVLSGLVRRIDREIRVTSAADPEGVEKAVAFLSEEPGDAPEES